MEQAPATQAASGEYELEDGLVRLRAGRCPECGAVFCPYGLVCPGCGHRGLDEILLQPGGTIYTYTRVHQSTPQFETPYDLVYVDFLENVRVMLPALGDGPPVIGEQVEIVLARGPHIENGELVDAPHARMVPERSGQDG